MIRAKDDTSCESTADNGYDAQVIRAKDDTGYEVTADEDCDAEVIRAKDNTVCESTADDGCHTQVIRAKDDTSCEVTADDGCDAQVIRAKNDTGCESIAQTNSNELVGSKSVESDNVNQPQPSSERLEKSTDSTNSSKAQSVVYDALTADGVHSSTDVLAMPTRVLTSVSEQYSETSSNMPDDVSCSTKVSKHSRTDSGSELIDEQPGRVEILSVETSSTTVKTYCGIPNAALNSSSQNLDAHLNANCGLNQSSVVVVPNSGPVLTIAPASDTLCNNTLDCISTCAGMMENSTQSLFSASPCSQDISYTELKPTDLSQPSVFTSDSSDTSHVLSGVAVSSADCQPTTDGAFVNQQMGGDIVQTEKRIANLVPESMKVAAVHFFNLCASTYM